MEDHIYSCKGVYCMKKRIIVFLFILSLSFLPIKVSAHTVKSEIILSNEDVTKEETLKVTVKLTQEENIKLNVFQARIDFDEFIFSGIDTSTLFGSNGWGNIEYNPETHTLVAINKYGTTLNEDVLSFELKTRNDISPSKTKVGLSNARVSSTREELEIDSVESPIQINLLSNQVAGTSSLNSNFGKNLVVSSVKLYYILTISILELLIAIILIALYRTVIAKISPSRKGKCFLGAVLCLIEIASISAFFCYDIAKGDLNGDKVVDYEDIKILSRHLTNSEILSTYKLEKADLDGDRRLSTRDLAQLVEKSFSKMTYDAKLTNILLEENGYEKGSTVEVKFLADVTDDEKIEFVLIDGKKYKADKSPSNSNEYTVKLEASNISNRYNYSVTEIILANGRSAKVDYETSIEVLKDIPTFGNFASKEDVEHGKMDVAFTIEDFDNAITSATYELVKKSGHIAQKGNLTKGKNALSLPLENAIDYKLNIKISYNRGSTSGEYFGMIEDSYDLKLITDYKFKMSNISLVQNGGRTKDLERNTETYLEFSSSNITSYTPKKLTVNSREYTVSNLGNNRYRIRIPNIHLNEKNLSLTKVTLSNGKTFSLKENVSYNVLKEKPIVIGITTDENTQEDKISVDIDYKDLEYTIKSFKVELYDASNNLISVVSSETPHLELKTSMTHKYKIKVYANCDRGFGNIEKDMFLYETTIDAKIKASLVSANLSEKFPDKSSVVTFDYAIKSNYGIPVESLVIDNVIYKTTKIEGDTYRIEINVGNTSGVKTYNLESINFAGGLEYKISNTLKLDVIKDIPILENFKIEEDIENNRITATFDFFDLDSAYTGGTLRLIDKETAEVVSKKDIAPGKNSVTFAVEELKKYSLGIFIDAELDTKELNANSGNILKDEKLYETEYMLITDYNLVITEVETVEDSFEKNNKVDISFASTNRTEYYPIKIKVNGQIYDLEKKENKYFFSLNSKDVAGTLNLNFESIILNNQKEITVNCAKSIEVLKSAPTIENLEVKRENNKVYLNFDILDKDDALNKLETTITDENDKEVFKGSPAEEIVLDEFEGTYKISVIGTYNTSTKEAKDEKYSKTTVLFEKELDLKAKVIDALSLKTFEFEDVDKKVSKEVEYTSLDTQKLIVRELETAGMKYKVDRITVDKDGKIYAKIDASLFFLKDEKRISSINIAVGLLEGNRIILKNLP